MLYEKESETIMEIVKNGVRINRKEMQAIKRLDHHELEEYLTMVYGKGRQAATGQWKQAVTETLLETKGIGPGRKELFVERLNGKMNGVGK